MEVEAIHYSPTECPSYTQGHPDDHGEDVIAKDHIIYNGAVSPGQNPPKNKDPHHNQPAGETSLFLQPKSIERDATGDEQENALKDAEKGRHHEDVSNVMVADIDEVKGEEINSGVTGPGSCLLQTVGIETCLN